MQPGKEGIELFRQCDLGEPFFDASEQNETKTIMMVDFAIIRIQFYPAKEGALGGWPISLIIHLDTGEEMIRFGQRVIQFQRLLKERLGRCPVFRRQNRIGRAKGMIPAKANVSGGKAGIEFDGTL